MIVPVTHVTTGFAKMASIAMTAYANLASQVGFGVNKTLIKTNKHPLPHFQPP